MSDQTKTVSISGGAADDYMGGAKRRKRAPSRKKGGSHEEVRGVSSIVNAVKGVESSSTAFAASPAPSTWLAAPKQVMVPPIVPQPSFQPATPAQSAAPFQTGGVKQIKVELKKKPTAKKVQLHPKKAEVVKHPSQKKHQTKKARKITLGVAALQKRLTRAKKVHKKVKSMPLEELKKQLIEKKLIKPTSKAPESVLRQIAADAQIVAHKAL